MSEVPLYCVRLFGAWIERALGVRGERPLSGEERSTWNVLRTFTLKHFEDFYLSRPESGLDCLMCTIHDRRRLCVTLDRALTVWHAPYSIDSGCVSLSMIQLGGPTVSGPSPGPASVFAP